MGIRFVLPFVVLGLVAGCGGSSSPTTPSSGSSSSGSSGGSSSNGSFSATIDGSAFSPTSVTARHFLGASANPDENFGVNAVDAANNLLGFEVTRGPKQLLTLGPYTLGGQLEASTANYVTVGGGSTWLATAGVGSGTVTLNTFSTTTKTASGTFSFVLKNGNSTKTVTNGTFNVTFP